MENHMENHSENHVENLLENHVENRFWSILIWIHCCQLTSWSARQATYLELVSWFNDSSLCAVLTAVLTITFLRAQWFVDGLPGNHGPHPKLPSRKSLHENCDGHSLAMQSSQLQKGPRHPTVQHVQPDVPFILAGVLHSKKKYIYIIYLLSDICNKKKSLGYTVYTHDIYYIYNIIYTYVIYI
jgi:hypothetical protein